MNSQIFFGTILIEDKLERDTGQELDAIRQSSEENTEVG
jgi:hypothetical protein